MGGPAVVVSLGRRDAARPDGEGRLPEGGLTVTGRQGQLMGMPISQQKQGI